MYMKEPEKCYRYNDAEDADFTKIVDPKHTALLMIDSLQEASGSRQTGQCIRRSHSAKYAAGGAE